ncbi:hypothetical protein GWI33_008554 [Rhynchophorus ferrugineus]|uniref:Uncharacterized protein n=1 Tax=Rhynchophorus ferrugineus TaxID=354439 RepID=A0A834MHA3_RHYFE|nr:hypothetical protein GWI33_008554 [Rhynchophorus ferrugineus]
MPCGELLRITIRLVRSIHTLCIRMIDVGKAMKWDDCATLQGSQKRAIYIFFAFVASTVTTYRQFQQEIVGGVVPGEGSIIPGCMSLG